MGTVESEWDSYVPATPGEFDHCPACRGGSDHSVAEHQVLVKEALQRASKREDALNRAAARTYDRD